MYACRLCGICKRFNTPSREIFFNLAVYLTSCRKQEYWLEGKEETKNLSKEQDLFNQEIQQFFLSILESYHNHIVLSMGSNVCMWAETFQCNYQILCFHFETSCRSKRGHWEMCIRLCIQMLTNAKHMLQIVPTLSLLSCTTFTTLPFVFYSWFNFIVTLSPESQGVFASGPTGTDACIDLESRLITAVWMNDTRWTKQ